MPFPGLAIAAGLGIDRLAGEPPLIVHPVARFGQLMGAVERRVYRDEVTAGVVFCAIGVAGAAAAGVLASRLVGRRAATAIATSIAVAGRMLGREANSIGDVLVAGDLVVARAQLPSLVGRSPDDLSETEIARAVVESVAENAVDAVVATVVWAAIGGAPLVLAHRAVNTLDAMVGHRTPRYRRFGWASARLDDVANWVPARLGAVCVAACRPSRASAILRTVHRDAKQHPSPNGGVIEAAFAAALQVRLGGANRYGELVEDRGLLGDGAAPQASDIRRSVALLDHVTALLAAVCAGAALIGNVRQRGGSVA